MARARKQGRPRAADAALAPPPVRQRQRLIDATISALHQYGPTGTTVARVVAIARLSPGIVRFYFRSKAAMLVAALQFLATEFEDRVMVPVAALRDRPALALERLVDLYLDPDIASPRKVAVWYAFWGEASARQEYLAICGQKDTNFAALVHDLIERMIAVSGRRHLDADAVALGLIGVLEMLWQAFAFEEEAAIDRAAARRRCMAYLRSVFPREFAATGEAGAALEDAAARPGGSDLRPAWFCVGHESELSGPHSLLASELPTTRVLLVRDAAGHLRAFRNACTRQPHTLATDRTGRADAGIACATHGLHWGLDGRPLEPATGAALTELELQGADGLLFVRAAHGNATPPALVPGLAAGRFELLPGGALQQRDVAAGWTTVVEQWLDARLLSGAGERAAGPSGKVRLEIDERRGDVVASEAGVARCQFVAPATLIERSPDGLRVLQAVPIGAGHCRVQVFEFPVAGNAGAGDWLRNGRARLEQELALAASVERGRADPDYVPDAHEVPSPAVAAFRRTLSGSGG